MEQPSSSERLSHSPFSPHLLKSPRGVAQIFTNIFTIILLALSALALTATAIYLFERMNDSPVASSASLLNATFICFLVIAGGSLLSAVGWVFPVLRLNVWQLILILLGAVLGMNVGLRQIAYESIGGGQGTMQIGLGYPFAAMRFEITPSYLMPWNQFYELIQHHSNQVMQDGSWDIPATLDTIFYAHVTLIPVVILGSLLRLFVQRAQGREAHTISSRS